MTGNEVLELLRNPLENTEEIEKQASFKSRVAKMLGEKAISNMPGANLEAAKRAIHNVTVLGGKGKHGRVDAVVERLGKARTELPAVFKDMDPEKMKKLLPLHKRLGLVFTQGGLGKDVSAGRIATGAAGGVGSIGLSALAYKLSKGKKK